jgi:hypothetical protein
LGYNLVDFSLPHLVNLLAVVDNSGFIPCIHNNAKAYYFDLSYIGMYMYLSYKMGEITFNGSYASYICMHILILKTLPGLLVDNAIQV